MVRGVCTKFQVSVVFRLVGVNVGVPDCLRAQRGFENLTFSTFLDALKNKVTDFLQKRKLAMGRNMKQALKIQITR